MILFLLTVFIVSALIYWRRWQQAYENKSLKDVIKNEELKVYLNRPHQKEKFSGALQKTIHRDDNQKSILNAFNDKRDL